jgi:hypothetical protein
MLFFILGLMMGCCLSFLLVAMLANFKKSDEAAIQHMADRERDIQKYLPVIQQSGI